MHAVVISRTPHRRRNSVRNGLLRIAGPASERGGFTTLQIHGRLMRPLRSAANVRAVPRRNNEPASLDECMGGRHGQLEKSPLIFRTSPAHAFV